MEINNLYTAMRSMTQEDKDNLLIYAVNIHSIFSHYTTNSNLNSFIATIKNFIALLLEVGANPAAQDSNSIQIASKNGSADVVKLLIDCLIEKKYVNSDELHQILHDLINLSARLGQIDVFNLLITKDDFKCSELDYACFAATLYGQANIIKFLITKYGSKLLDLRINFFISLAKEKEYFDIVDLFQKLIDTKIIQ